MGQKVLILRGLPASGKSTYAKEVVQKDNKWKRINRDSIRLMLAQDFSDRNEKFVKAVRDNLIQLALSKGYNVIVDDLNLSEKNIIRIKQVVGNKAEILINDSFLSVPLNELIKRNKERNKIDRVPDSVIEKLYEQFVSKSLTKEERQKLYFTKKVSYNTVPLKEELQNIIIVDIDGTIALMNGRSPFDMSAVSSDLPNVPVIRLIKDLINYNSFLNPKIFFVSGRNEEARQTTQNWIRTYVGWESDKYSIFMRADNDNRKDSIIKEEIYNKNIKDKYNVLFVLDDRNQTVEKWREIGLPTFQVAEGNF